MDPNNPDIQTKGINLNEDIVLALLEGLCDELTLCDFTDCRPVVNDLALQVMEVIRKATKTIK